MVSFAVKEIDDRTLGDMLRSKREERGSTLEDVERATQVSKKYIAALEQNDFMKLPEPVYAKRFARALAKHYQLDPNTVVENLLKEMTAAVEAPAISHPTTFVQGRAMLSTPSIMKVILGGLAFLAVVGYFAVSVHRILKPPEVTLFSPQDDQMFGSSRVPLEGVTEPEVELTVNGEAVPTEADGSFKELLTLPPGVSDLRIAAKKRHSREREVYLKVVVEESAPADPNASASGTPDP
jgi:cytoskeletal protein RodZ